MKQIKNILSIFCAVLLIFSAVPPVLAEGAPELFCSGGTVTLGGGSGYCFLQMRNAEDIAAMDYLILYDSENLELSASYTTGFTSQEDVTVSINDTEPGQIHVTLVSQNGLNGTDYLNLLYFRAKQGARTGTYPITVLVNDIYNSALETVTAKKTNGTITVNEPAQTVKSVRFSGTLSAEELTCGESLQYQLNISSLNELSAGTLDITYDETKLRLDHVTLSEALQNTVYDVNSAMPGLVKLSFASEKAITSGSNAVMLEFLAQAAGSAEIRFKPSELYDHDFHSMSGNELVKTVTITEPEQTAENPELRILLPENIPSDKEFIIQAVLEGGSGVRAGDFVLNYDSSILECLGVSVEKKSGVYVVADQKYSDGRVRFSLMSNVELDEDTPLVSIRLKSRDNKASRSVVSTSGTGIYDVDFNQVTLDYKAAEIAAVRPEYMVHFYDSDGKTLLLSQTVWSGNSAIPPKMPEVKACDKAAHFRFSGWDKEYSVISDDTDITASYQKEAHTEVSLAETAPGIDTPGFSGGSKCVVCDEILKEGSVIPPKGASVSAELDKNGLLTISGALSDREQTENSVLLGIYSQKRLLRFADISAENQNHFTLALENLSGADTVKIFRWESISNLKPVGSVITAPVHHAVPYIFATLSENHILTISGALSDQETARGSVLAGIYAGQRLIRLVDLSAQRQNDVSLKIEHMANAETVKIFQWESLFALLPISDVLSARVSR